jgi:hypothetical protein
MPLICGQCLNSSCGQWELKLTDLQKIDKGLFYDHMIGVHLVTLRCRCQGEITFEADQSSRPQVYKCASCETAAIFSLNEVTISQVCALLRKFPIVKYIRSKCPECRGSGQVQRQTYHKCPGCEGQGGIMCLQCHGLGCHKPNMCQSGYLEKCYQCGGQQTIRKGLVDYACRCCMVLPPQCPANEEAKLNEHRLIRSASLENVISDYEVINM